MNLTDPPSSTTSRKATGEATTTDTCSQHTRAGRRGGHEQRRARSPSVTGGLPHHASQEQPLSRDTDPARNTGRRSITAVSSPDNGACFRSGGFQRFIDSRAEFVHVRTRVKAPETNGVVERWIESSKYERLYREEIPDGLALQAQLDDYRDFYNAVRPHETLDQTLPISRYLAQPDNDESEEANLETARSISES